MRYYQQYLDLGSVWINQLIWLNENPVILEKMQELGMADDERVYGALALGYADTEDENRQQGIVINLAIFFLI